MPCHGDDALAAYGKPVSRQSVTSIPPRWWQHLCRSALLHMASLCPGNLSLLFRPGGGNTSAAAYCCIWQAYVTAFGLAPGLTGQRLPFTSWLIGSVTRRHCGAVSLSRSLLTIVSSFYLSPVDSCCSTIGMRTPRCTCIQSPVACV